MHLPRKNTEPSVQSILSKQKETQHIAGVRTPLHQPQKQMFWLRFNRRIHYLCSYARRDKDRVNPTKQMHTHRKPCSDACSHGRCITYPGTFIMCSLQTSPTVNIPCFPYWLFWLWIFCCCCCCFLMCRAKFSRCFPAVDEFLMSRLASGDPCCTAWPWLCCHRGVIQFLGGQGSATQVQLLSTGCNFVISTLDFLFFAVDPAASQCCHAPQSWVAAG